MTVGVNVNSKRALPSGESMRTLLIGALSVILAGCGCFNSPQAMLEGCTSKGCLYRTAASPPAELKPAPFTPNPSKAKKKPKKLAKTTTPSSAKSGNGAGPTKERANSPVIAKPAVPPTGRPAEMSVPDLKKTEPAMPAKMEVAAPGQPSETSDPALKKAKTTVAAKMDDPASAEFVDMKRAIRRNTFGQSFDIICGHVKGKKTSGDATGERAFLYLVKEDEAFIVGSNPDSVAAIAYRAHCTSPDLHGQNLRQQQNRE